MQRKSQSKENSSQQSQQPAGNEACIILLKFNRTKENVKMKTTVKVICVLVFLSGLVWFLQGINILPGSFMTGDPQWAINGGIMMVVSGGVFWFVNRK